MLTQNYNNGGDYCQLDLHSNYFSVVKQSSNGAECVTKDDFVFINFYYHVGYADSENYLKGNTQPFDVNKIEFIQVLESYFDADPTEKQLSHYHLTMHAKYNWDFSYI